MRASCLMLLAAWSLHASDIGTFTELSRFAAPEARQGVAADAVFLYAIGNHAVAKYRKDTRDRVAGWECPEGEPLIHINAGLVIGGRLYGAHSNFPGVPHHSSVEIWDTQTLRHVGSHSLGRTDGSLTWLARRENRWLACFVHYGGKGGEPGRGPEWSRIVEMDDDWRVTGGWALPAPLVAALGSRGYSVSGGAIGPDGRLYVTGHDEAELYVLEFPAGGAEMRLLGTIPVPAEGQAFAWDPNERDIIHLILKRTREIITGRITLTPPRSLLTP